MSVLEVSNLSKSFGGVRAVRNLGFSVDVGEIVGLIGPNGSGKSTSLSLIMGIIRPDTGSIRLDGKDITRQPTHRTARAGVGMVFQHSRPLRRQSVLEHIKLALLPGLRFRLSSHSSMERRARDIAERVGLGRVADEHPDSLPFADLRRLEFAKAVAQDPQLILLDEPFAGLAPRELQELSDLTLSFKEEGHAIILVDHNVKAVAGLADRVVAMYVGEKIAEGPPHAVTKDPKVREVYFGSSLDDGPSLFLGEGIQAGESLLDADIQDLHYGKARALGRVRLQVDEGECVSVVGLNGAGKSSFFKAVLGFVDYSGDVRWRGESVRGQGPAAMIRRGISQCPETRELFPFMTVRENLEMGGQFLNKTELADNLDRICELFPILSQRQNQMAYTLSGGEQQMLTIGRALMQNPKLLILDEPTLGLAPLVIETISETLDQLQREMNLTILIGEQNVTFALRHSNRIYLLEHGELRWHGGAREFSEEISEAYL